MRNRKNNRYEQNQDDEFSSAEAPANADQKPVIAFGMSIWLPNDDRDEDGNELPEEEWKSEWQKMEEQREREVRDVDDVGCEREGMTCQRAFWIRFRSFLDAENFREELEAVESKVAAAFGTLLAYAEAKAKARSSPNIRRVGRRRRRDADE